MKRRTIILRGVRFVKKGNFKTTMKFKMRKARRRGVDGEKRFESQRFQIVACLKVENFIEQSMTRRRSGELWKGFKPYPTLGGELNCTDVHKDIVVEYMQFL